jgi:hypothetical protein
MTASADDLPVEVSQVDVSTSAKAASGDHL